MGSRVFNSGALRLASATSVAALSLVALPVTAGASTNGSVLDDPAQVLSGQISLQAQRICNGIFITRLPAKRYLAIFNQFNDGSRVQDLYPHAHWSTRIDASEHSVTVSGWGASLPASETVTVRRVDGFGCVPLAPDGKLHFSARPPRRNLPSVAASNSTAWPLGDHVSPYVWRNKAGERAIQAQVDAMFEDPGQFGFTLAYHGRILYEHYAPGLGPTSKADGYSLTKSLVATLIGALIQKGWLNLNSPGGLPAWRTPGDARGRVTVNDLLRMESGLSFPISTGPGAPTFADYTPNALAASEIPGDTLARLNQLQVQTAPGGPSHYLNANYELLSARAAEVLRAHGMSVDAGYYNLVFDKLDMRTVEFRADAYGHLAGPRHATASARDWNKLGQLYVNNGRWEGEQILPKWWRAYVTSSSGLSDGGPQTYGAGFWNTVVGDDATQAVLKNQPSDAFYGFGAQYQYLAVWPAEGVVMSLTSDGADSQVRLSSYERLCGIILNLVRHHDLR